MTDRPNAPFFILPILVVALSAASGCQRIEEPVPTPTADQWRRVQENLLHEAPTPQVPVGATFGDSIRLIGWDVDSPSVEVGDEVTLTLYWEALRPIEERWWIFIHLDSNTRQNLDHEAIRDLYPTLYWQQGDVIRDIVTTTIIEGTEPGDVRVLVGLFRGDDRMPVSEPGSGVVQEDGRLDVGAFEATWTAPTYLVRRATTPIEIDGRATDRAWSRAQRTANWVHPNTGQEVDSLNSWAKMLWDDEFLYVLLNARDDDVWATLDTRDADLWTEEVLEVYLDPGSDGREYLELQINPLNAVFDAVFQSADGRDIAAAKAFDIAGLEHAVYVSGTLDDREDRDRSWTAEIRIPLASIPGLAPIDPDNPDALRVNFYRYDRPADGEVATAAWSPIGGGTFHNPNRFGKVTFEAPQPDEEPDRSEGSGQEGAVLDSPVRLERIPQRPNRQGRE